MKSLSDSPTDRFNSRFFDNIGFRRNEIFQDFNYEVQPEYDEEWMESHLWWWRILPSEIHKIIHIPEQNDLNRDILERWIRRAISEHSYSSKHDQNIRMRKFHELPLKEARKAARDQEATVEDLYAAYENGLRHLVSDTESLAIFLNDAYKYELRSRIAGIFLSRYSWIDSDESTRLLFIQDRATEIDNNLGEKGSNRYFLTGSALDYKMKSKKSPPVRSIKIPESEIQVDISKTTGEAIEAHIEKYKEQLKEKVNQFKKDTPWKTGRGKGSTFSKGRTYFRDLERLDKITLQLRRFHNSDQDYDGTSEKSIDMESKKSLAKIIRKFIETEEI